MPCAVRTYPVDGLTTRELEANLMQLQSFRLYEAIPFVNYVRYIDV